ncbi:MAG TPA: DNA polymerase III subunit gamma/tau [Microbacterium sp.]|nr:DNA polymerase III subunit gamma/tau [Microbacterium sp.]
MPPERDEALSWEGDDDPTLADSAARAEAETDASAEREASVSSPVALPEGFTAVGRGSEDVGRIEPDGTVVTPGERQPMGNAALIGFGVLGGVYLLFTIGWIVGGLRLAGVAQFLVSPVIYQFALWLAVLAAPLWFATAHLLTRDSKTWVRIVWLLAGAALLVPWPFVMTGAVGQ